MDAALVAEFAGLHAKAKTGTLDAQQQARWLELKKALITQSSEKRPLPLTARPISRPG